MPRRRSSSGHEQCRARETARAEREQAIAHHSTAHPKAFATRQPAAGQGLGVHPGENEVALAGHGPAPADGYGLRSRSAEGYVAAAYSLASR